MNKAEREVRRLLKKHPHARLEKNGRAGFVLYANGRSLNLGGLQGDGYKQKVERFLHGRIAP